MAKKEDGFAPVLTDMAKTEPDVVRKLKAFLASVDSRDSVFVGVIIHGQSYMLWRTDDGIGQKMSEHWEDLNECKPLIESGTSSRLN